MSVSIPAAFAWAMYPPPLPVTMPTWPVTAGPPGISRALAASCPSIRRHQFFARQRQFAVHAEPLAAIVAEPPFQRDVEPPRQHHVVADLGVDVERDVRRVERDVAVEQGTDPAVAAAGQWRVAVPEQPMMDQEQRAAASPSGAAPRIASSEASTAATIRSTVPRFSTWRPLTALLLVGDVAHLEEGVQIFGQRAEGNRVLAHGPSCCRMLSSAAWTRAASAAGTSESRAGLGT